MLHYHGTQFPPTVGATTPRQPLLVEAPRMTTYDLVLVHPPSVFDFRERPIFYGPLADVIPLSPIFEMYPVGFLTLAAHLERAGFRTRIVNLALLMMRNRGFDPERHLARIDARAFGVDLHWLPHMHGAFETARLLRRVHPGTPIVMGGLTASYFHEELVQEPSVDFVVRGSVTEPSVEALLKEIRGSLEFARVPGLTWKADGAVRANAPVPTPPTLDPYGYDLGFMIRSMVCRLDFWESAPFGRWWRHPISAVFTVRGCARSCVTCGAASDAFPRFLPGRHFILRSPESIAREARAIAGLTRAPIFLVGDLLDGGEGYAGCALCGGDREPAYLRVLRAPAGLVRAAGLGAPSRVCCANFAR
jgi:B12-binding domain/radical SAM domain protein